MVSVRRRFVSAAVAVAAAGFVLSACGGGQAAGSAAVLGDQRITTGAVSDALTEINEGLGRPANTPNAAAVQSNVQRLIRGNLVDQAADRLAVSVDEGAVDRELLNTLANAGGQQALDDALLQSDIPPSAIADEIRVSLLLGEIGAALAPDADQQVRNTLVFEYLVALSNELDVTVSARFGSWDTAELAVGPIPTDVASPVSSPLGG